MENSREGIFCLGLGHKITPRWVTGQGNNIFWLSTPGTCALPCNQGQGDLTNKSYQNHKAGAKEELLEKVQVLLAGFPLSCFPFSDNPPVPILSLPTILAHTPSPAALSTHPSIRDPPSIDTSVPALFLAKYTVPQIQPLSLCYLMAFRPAMSYKGFSDPCWMSISILKSESSFS